MITGSALTDLADTIAAECRSGLDLDALRARVLPRLRRAVPLDALWWAAVDPTTLLFTRAYREELPADSGPYFVENEFLRSDVNKWTDLVHSPSGVRTLMQATDGRPTQSGRFRDIFEPLGLGDELRVVLRSRGACWGYLCLHRQAGRDFDADEVEFVRRIAAPLADGIRQALLLGACEADSPANAPGLVLLQADGEVLAANSAADSWLEELGGDPSGEGLPDEIRALAASLQHLGTAAPTVPRLRVRTKAGRWAVLHASYMRQRGEDVIAVVLDEAPPTEVTPVIMRAYGLTDRERQVTALVCRGLTTRQIADRLHLSADTVQDHLKSIFDRTGVRSRGELTATVLRTDYLTRAFRPR